MDERVFESIAENFQKAVCDDIAYTYSVFVPRDTKNILSKMKSNISLQEERFLEPRSKKELGGKSVSPYDILIPKLKKHISDFYSEFRLSPSTLEKLSQYGERTEVFKKQFRENLEKSKATTTKTILGEMELQIARGNDVKSVISHMRNILSNRTTALRQALEQSAGQMKQYMVLWDYQDKGFTDYRLRTNGDNCKSCTALEGKIFSISKAEVGINLAPLHPNCDCTAEIVDKQGNTVFALDKKAKSEEASKTLEYLHTSLKQVVLGNFSEDTNLLGTLGQIALGLAGLDLPADVRDLFYDITNWKTSPEHILQTLLDAAALLPVVGSLKYTDEAADLLKAAAKHGDEATEIVKPTTSSTEKLPWDSWQNYEKVKVDNQIYAKIGNRLYSEHAVNRMQPSGNRFGPNIYQGLGGKDYGRSISPQHIEYVITSSKAVFQPETGNYIHSLGTVKVVVNSLGAVVTVITYQ